MEFAAMPCGLAIIIFIICFAAVMAGEIGNGSEDSNE